jgi:alkylation response protein AidB-like acyl-CoA dehydrogenase
LVKEMLSLTSLSSKNETSPSGSPTNTPWLSDTIRRATDFYAFDYQQGQTAKPRLQSQAMNALDLKSIRKRADSYDQTGDWPSEDLDVLATAGAMRWVVPAAFGGDDLDPLELHFRYEQIAAASLSTALVLTQRDAAVGMILASENTTVHNDLLPPLARHETFTTIGIAQLTTSRQGGRPAMIARRESTGWMVNGLIPWSTGADRSRFIVAGAAVEESTAENISTAPQILFLLSTNDHGVTIEPPMPLVALQSSHTGALKCEDVFIDDRFVLKGPAQNVAAGRKKSVPLGQAFLAMGLCRAGIDLIAEHDSQRAQQTVIAFDSQLSALRQQVVEYCRPNAKSDVKLDSAVGPQLRGACNELAIRITHAAVAIYKGSALLRGHPAQRYAREAMFLLVWSCPDSVIECTVELLQASC